MANFMTEANTEISYFNVRKVRQDFPILQQHIKSKPLVYLDNAATSQKPLTVIEAMNHFYHHDNANIHRGVHTLSERATTAYEASREKVKTFINATSIKEIIFVDGTTEAINLVAQSYGRSRFTAGDEIIISTMEHHSNIVPWQLLCEQTGALLKVIPINAAGELILEEYTKLLGPRTKLVAIAHVSNALGTINPIREMIQQAHAQNIPVLVDGAQATPHLKVDVQALDCDFYAFSAHKMFGPMGVGVLYGKQTLLDAMPPYQGGGDMIRQVTLTKSTFNDLPFKFEAGTPNVAGVIGLGAAIDYMNKISLDTISRYEHSLTKYATDLLCEIPGFRMIGTAAQKTGVLSFILDDIHAHDIGTILNEEGIAIRSGHHCAMPVMQHFNVPATARASLAFYNTPEEIDALASALIKVKEIFK